MPVIVAHKEFKQASFFTFKNKRLEQTRATKKTFFYSEHYNLSLS